MIKQVILAVIFSLSCFAASSTENEVSCDGARKLIGLFEKIQRGEYVDLMDARNIIDQQIDRLRQEVDFLKNPSHPLAASFFYIRSYYGYYFNGICFEAQIFERGKAADATPLERYNLGIYYYKKRDKDATLYNLKAAADAGLTYAQFKLGIIYRYNLLNAGENYSLALQYFILLHNKKYAPATTELATLYSHGDGVEKDLNKAIALYKEATSSGDKLAKSILKDNFGINYS